VASRATTLRSSVLKDRVGSVRSQAAARYDVSPAELVSAAMFPNPDPKQGKIDENAIAKVLAKASGAPYLKIDPLAIDNDLVAKTLSRRSRTGMW
jgi:general secretion pathway protein E